MSSLVSVVIPCRNEMKYICDCVQSILNSDYPKIEILVVDGMSDDGTREQLKHLIEINGNIRIIDNPEKLTPFAFNYGVRNAVGDFIQIVGARNILAPDYISILVDTLNMNAEIGCVGGNYQHIYDSEQAKYISMAMESPFGVGGSNYRTMTDSCFVDTVGVPMYRKEIFEEIGYFDEYLTRNQDDDFNFRVVRRGYKIYYNAKAKCTYFVRGSYSKLSRQMGQYGYFKVFVNRKHGTITTLRQIVPALFLLFMTLGILLSFFFPKFKILYSLVLLLYFLLGFSFSFRLEKKMGGVLLVQYAIFRMHVGYGAGYIKGIWHFLVLNKKFPDGVMEGQTT